MSRPARPRVEGNARRAPALTALLLAASGCSSGTFRLPDLPGPSDAGADGSVAGVCDSDRDCSGATPRCYLLRRTCVACLGPSTTDNCPAGQVCRTTGDPFRCVSDCQSSADCLKLAGVEAECCGGSCLDTLNDPKNCGGCGVMCAAPRNADPACFGGHCILCSCSPGFTDCDHDVTNCCETPTGTDPLNCGACGHVCPTIPGTRPSCFDGQCGVICSRGYAHCSQRLEDGCEVDLTSDPQHCGSCDRVCTAPAHAVAACDEFKCGFRCRPGWGDCDGDPANGCEADLTGDSNCGGCGVACVGLMRCLNGACR